MNTETTELKLHSCPFCGRTDISPFYGSDGWVIKCHNCGIVIGPYYNRDAAVNAWNRRPDIRDRDEIQKAHDILIAILLDELPMLINAATRADIHAACDVLCWALNHDHNDSFSKNMKNIEQWAEQNGYILENQGSPKPHPKRS